MANNYAQLPSTNSQGYVLTSKGDGSGGGYWVAPSTLITGAKTRYDDYTFSVSGTLAVPSGATNFLPPFFKVLQSGETATLVSVRYMVRAGTATISINQNGSGATGFTGLSVTTTPTSTTPTPVTVTSGDYFAPVITAVSGSDGLSCTLTFAVTE